MDPTLRENAAGQGGDATLREGASSGSLALVPGSLFLGCTLVRPLKAATLEKLRFLEARVLASGRFQSLEDWHRVRLSSQCEFELKVA